MLIAVVAQGLILGTLLAIRNQALAGLIHTCCACLYLLGHDDDASHNKLLDVLTEAVIALSDLTEFNYLRLASSILCAYCAVRFACAARLTRNDWWLAAESVNSAADGIWAATVYIDPSTSDDARLATTCHIALTAMAILLLIDALYDQRQAHSKVA